MGIKDLLNSEKGLGFLLLVGIFTGFVFAGMATVSEWKEIVLPVFGIYAGTKTATTIGMAMANRGQGNGPPDPLPQTSAPGNSPPRPTPMPPPLPPAG